MPSVIYQVPTRQVQPFLIFGRLLSVIFFTAILCLGWAILSYVKNGTFIRKNSLNTGTKQNFIVNNDASTKVNAMATGGATKTSVKPARLVYASVSDKKFFHSIKHLTEQNSRIALSEEAAKARGLKPCSCIIE
ncbi:MAG: hypothetical protein AB1757_30920 [Acidobacteriota bacterium]